LLGTLMLLSFIVTVHGLQLVTQEPAVYKFLNKFTFI